MIATVSPADVNTQETVSTLRFADRAKHITTKSRVNMSSPQAILIAELVSGRNTNFILIWVIMSMLILPCEYYS